MQIDRKKSVSRRKLLIKTDCIIDVACINFVEKTFAGGYKITKFMKVFSFKNCPPFGYGNFMHD